MHAAEQAGQAKKMVAVQVRNKNMVDSLELGFKAPELNLRGFPAINKKITLSNIKQLRTRISIAGGAGRGTSEYEQIKTLAHVL